MRKLEHKELPKLTQPTVAELHLVLRSSCSAYLNGCRAALDHLLQEALRTNSIEGPGLGGGRTAALDVDVVGRETEQEVQATPYASLTTSPPLPGESASLQTDPSPCPCLRTSLTYP